MKDQPPVVKRIALFALGLVMALGSSLSTLDGGTALTISQMGDIPLIAWMFAIGAGISGALGISPKDDEK